MQNFLFPIIYLFQPLCQVPHIALVYVPHWLGIQRCKKSFILEIYKDLAMQFAHFNNGSLALTYLTDLLQPYDLELFFHKIRSLKCPILNNLPWVMAIS